MNRRYSAVFVRTMYMDQDHRISAVNDSSYLISAAYPEKDEKEVDRNTDKI
jgi:hypothetical protein